MGLQSHGDSSSNLVDMGAEGCFHIYDIIDIFSCYLFIHFIFFC